MRWKFNWRNPTPETDAHHSVGLGGLSPLMAVEWCYRVMFLFPHKQHTSTGANSKHINLLPDTLFISTCEREGHVILQVAAAVLNPTGWLGSLRTGGGTWGDSVKCLHATPSWRSSLLAGEKRTAGNASHGGGTCLCAAISRPTLRVISAYIIPNWSEQ